MQAILKGIYSCLFEAIIVSSINRVVTHDFQKCGILTSVDSGEPVQPPFKLRHSKTGSVSSLTVIKYSSD